MTLFASPTPAPKSNPLIDALRQQLYAAQMTEYQFQQEANFIRAFRRATPDLLLQLHADGTILNINHSAEFSLFHATAEILQRPIDEVLPVEAARDLRVAMERTLRERKPAQCIWTLPLDQQERHFEVRVAYLQPDQVLAIVRDITAHQQALDRLLEVPRQLLNAQEQERRRLAHDLHDEIGQDVTAILLTLHRAQSAPAGSSPQIIEEAEAALQTLARKVRGLAQELYPATLRESGLAAALGDLLERFVQQTMLRVDGRLPDITQRYPPEVEMAAYRIVQEALTNIARHAQAHAISLTVQPQADRLLIQIADDGQGFDATTFPRTETYGLRGMHDRAELLGGQLTIETTPGHGTRLQAELPLTERHAGWESR